MLGTLQPSNRMMFVYCKLHVNVNILVKLKVTTNWHSNYHIISTQVLENSIFQCFSSIAHSYW